MSRGTKRTLPHNTIRAVAEHATSPAKGRLRKGRTSLPTCCHTSFDVRHGRRVPWALATVLFHRSAVVAQP